jgi:diacylglycerol kinase
MNAREDERSYVERRIDGFRYAGRGLKHLMRQPHARVHALATVVVAALAAWLRLSANECALLALTVASVWTAEAFNTSLERLSDAVVPERHPLIAAAKDTAAGAVLLASLGSLAVAGFVFVPHLARLP